MSKFVIEVSSGHNRHMSHLAQRYVIDAKAQVMIGRGYHCDVIVDDPYVSKAHIMVYASAEGFDVVDLSSKNGTKLDGRELVDSPNFVSSGSVLQIGRSRVKLISSSHEVDEAKEFRLVNETKEFLGQKKIASLLLLLSSFLFILHQSIFSASVDYWGGDAAIEYLYSVGAISLISAITAIPNFVKTRHFNCLTNVSIISILLVGFLLLSSFQSLTAFRFVEYSYELGVFTALYGIFAFVGIGVAEYVDDGHMSKKNWALSALVSCLIMLFMAGHMIMPDDEEILTPYYSEALPGSAWVPKGLQSFDAFLEDSEIIFATGSDD